MVTQLVTTRLDGRSILGMRVHATSYADAVQRIAAWQLNAPKAAAFRLVKSYARRARITVEAACFLADSCLVEPTTS